MNPIDSQRPQASWSLRVGEIALLASAYIATARLGQLLAIDPGNITPVWPPAGIALAAVLWRGYRVWPGIFIGAFVGNVSAYYDAHPFGAMLFCGSLNGVGDVLAATVAAALIGRSMSTRYPLDSVSDVVRFIVFGGLLGPALSALFGVTGLALAGVLPWSNYLYSLLTWWTGDGVGALLVTPLLLVWTVNREDMQPKRLGESALLMFVFLLLCSLYIWAWRPSIYLCLSLSMPLVFWGTIRLHQRASLLNIMLISIMAFIAIAQSTHGAARNNELIELQLFIAVLTTMNLVMTGLFQERLLHWNALNHQRLESEKMVAERTRQLSDRNEELESEILERHKSETALEQSEKMYRKIVESAHEGIWVLDKEGKTSFVNQRMVDLLGYGIEEMQGRHLFDFMDDEGREIAQRNLQRREEGIEEDHDFRFVHKDGADIWTLINTNPLEDDEGQYIGALGMIADITERKAWEKQTERSLQEKDTLLREMHHRIKNNLQLIGSLLNMEQRNLSGKGKEIESLVSNMRRRIYSIAMIHDRLYRSDDLAGVDMKKYIPSLLADLRQMLFADKGQVRIEMDVEAGEDMAIELAVPCGLIINELVTNSIKYAFPKGGTGRISTRLFFRGERAFLHVADDGIGLPPDLDIATCSSLGLKLVNILQQQLDADLSIDSDENGTRFELSFPLTLEKREDINVQRSTLPIVEKSSELVA